MADLREKISATADTFVHYLFASRGNELILRSFVNAVQENAGQPLVKETQVINPFNPQTFRTEKRSIIDIKAISEKNHTFVIEFQVAGHPAFAERALYYWAKTFGQQLVEGEAYKKLTPVIVIALTCFPLFPELKKLHNTFWIAAQDAPEYVFTDRLQIHTLELADEKLKQIPAMNESLRWWLEFFHYSDKKSEAEMKFLLKNSEQGVRDAHDEYILFNQSEELRALAESRERYLHDYNTDVLVARREGKEEGKAEGEAEGRAKTLLSILTKRFQSVPESLKARILAITDSAHLEKLVDFVLDCESLEAFSEVL